MKPAWPDSLAALDAGRPWFEPWRDTGKRVATALQAGQPLYEALNGQGAGDPRFVASQELPAKTAYEQYIFETARCPTREGVHDFFNGLAWLQMPQSKRQLNRVQAQLIATAGVSGPRGPVRDAATLFDENGAVLSAPAPIWQALAERDWRRLFVELRPLWQRARLFIFGHALLEKLVQPRKNLTAHVWRAPFAGGSTAEMDSWLAARLTAQALAAKPFLPLPVLGIPGWWPDNQHDSFYDDPLVFRPAARPESRTTQAMRNFEPLN